MPAPLHPDDTITALASAPGCAERGIVRISGRGAAAVLETVFVADDNAAWANTHSARVHRGTVQVSGLSRPLPADLYFWPGHRSYTGEPVGELHLIGSPPILEAVLATLYRAGARPAQPGEFTLRAFLAGRVDLMQAEAVLGVIDAANTGELQAALAQLAGGISTHIGVLRSDLLDLLSDLEAGLDFADEAIEFVSHASLIERLQTHRRSLDDLIRQTGERARSSALPSVVLAGPPNAGKSTLFNALVGRSVALVSPVRGTTRDYLAAEVTWNSLTFLLVDTAGAEDFSGEGSDYEARPADNAFVASAATLGGVEDAAQTLRREQLARADLVVCCQAAEGASEAGDGGCVARGGNVRTHHSAATGRMELVVLTKGDLLAEDFLSDTSAHNGLTVSALTGRGLTELKDAIAARLSQPAFGSRQWIGSTAARCRESLTAAAEALDRAHEIAQHAADQELLAIETREALDALGEIVGAVYTDDILDRIFSKFCIGK